MWKWAAGRILDAVQQEVLRRLAAGELDNLLLRLIDRAGELARTEGGR